ncbi:MAG TPA: hypothetical protein VK992_06480 [Candidatus Caenarcaniphilales bacterium]|nr:hypothetical protein [Candidatus Caenarcaniphilales bacterium]
MTRVPVVAGTARAVAPGVSVFAMRSFMGLAMAGKVSGVVDDRIGGGSRRLLVVLEVVVMPLSGMAKVLPPIHVPALIRVAALFVSGRRRSAARRFLQVLLTLVQTIVPVHTPR